MNLTIADQIFIKLYLIDTILLDNSKDIKIILKTWGNKKVKK